MTRPTDEQVRALAESGLRLWKVEMRMDLYVMAEDEDEARQEAEYNAREEVGNAECDVFAVTDVRRVPLGWRGRIPYGLPSDCGDMEVADLIQHIRQTDIELEAAGQTTLTSETDNE